MKRLILISFVMLASAVCLAQARVEVRRDTLVACGGIYFHVSRTEVDTVYMQNGKRIREFASQLAESLDKPGARVTAVSVIGGASPEGRVAFNQELSVNRAKSIIEQVKRYFTPEQMVAWPQTYVTHLGADWAGLDTLVSKSDMQYRDEVLDIIRNTPVSVNENGGVVDERLRRLKALRQGQPYNWMLSNLFPELRKSTLEIACVVEYADTVQESVSEPVSEHQEMVGTQEPECIVEYVSDTVFRKHLLALRTNLLYDVFYMPNFGWAPSPNIQLEYYPAKGRYTFDIGFTCPYYKRWDKHKFFQIRDYNFEVRRFFKPADEWAVYTGLFLGLYVNNNIYGIGFDRDTGWEGEGFGGGVTLGYVMRLGHRHSRWRLEFTLGVGYYQTMYDPYVYGNPTTGNDDGLYYYDYSGKVKNFRERNHKFSWFGPTQGGIHLTYDLLYRKKIRKQSRSGGETMRNSASFRQIESITEREVKHIIEK